ncbi:MAG: OmpA/MotB domain-containing protein [bacterium]|nr:MAG: OmpA/MotB domain-containing protein [bacterium]KAF0150051.1 MAG: OmpA/MotB domain-containing protein [bacterium]KAF0169159.1 MAG: OmpA/MotB domain-containing protein [bacterium]TXT16205.1 MAG: OmpA/MotB domain-containing protein [bacterium]
MHSSLFRHKPSPVSARQSWTLLPLLLALGLGGCATQDYVRQEVGQYNDRVQGMESWFKAIELGLDTQAKRIREAELRADRLERDAAESGKLLRETRGELTAGAQRMQALAADQAATGRRLDSLDRQVATDLAAVNQRLQGTTADAARAHRRLDTQEARLEAADTRVSSVLASLDATGQRLGGLENQLAAMPGVPAPASAPAVIPAAHASAATERPTPAVVQVVTPSAPAAADAQTTALQGLILDIQRKLEQQHATLDALTARLGGVESGLTEQGRGGADRQAAMQTTNATLVDLRADLTRLRGESEEQARAIARIDQKMGGLGQDLASARQRVEQGEKALADSGLRLTLVQELVTKQGERLAQSESAYGQVSVTAREALDRAMQAGRLAEGKIVYEATLTDEVTHFALNEARLNAESRKQLDEFAAQLKAENRGAFIEIQGHTDNLGTAEVNQRLAQRRAMAVRDYLHQEAGIPLNLLAVAAYGASRPVADNASREGRAKNRRVVLVVLR